MNWHNIIYLIAVFVQINSSYSYRILALFPFKGSSHFNVLGQVAKALAEKGHQVDVISAFPLKEKFPNYRDLIIIPRSNNDTAYDYNDVKEVDQFFKEAHERYLVICSLLEHPKISNLINNPPTDPPYDLILTHLIPCYACFGAIGYLWNLPVVGISTTSLFPFYDHFIGNPMNLATSSRNQRVQKENMTFFDRLYNFVMTHRFISAYNSGGKDTDDVMKKYLGDRVPHYTELQRSVSLILSNSHHSLHGVQAKVPSLVEIGGIHVADNNSTVDPALKLIMDTSTEGFVYVSFGSRLLFETFPKEIVHRFFTVFESLAPMQVIVKIGNPKLLTLSVPKNVHFYSWLPQMKILQHRNIKAFVTHGGGLSTQEAVHYGVPIICVPAYGDQITNCGIASNKKFGLTLYYATAKQEDYFNVFNKILNDSSYAKASKKLSSLYRDRLISPRDEAVYWVEYVIRHGKNALRSPSVDLEWWQVQLWDILIFMTVFILLITGVGIFAVRKLFSLVLCKPPFQSNAQDALSKKMN